MDTLYKVNIKSVDSYESAIAISLSIMVFMFPIAHTATIKALCLVVPFTLWIAKMVIRREWRIQKTPVDLLLLFYLIFGLLSLFSSIDKAATLNSIKKEMIVNFILFYLIVNNLKKPFYIKPILIAILLGNMVMISYGLYDIFIAQRGNLFDPDIRFHSLSADFAFFSAYLVTIFPVIFIAFFYLKDLKNKILLSLLFILNILAIYLNHQRGAWAAVLIEFLFGLLMLKKWKLIGIFSLSLIVLIFLLPTDVFLHGEKVTPQFNREDIKEIGGSITPRIAVWNFAIEKIKEKPFLGYGLGRDNFTKKFPQLKEKFGPTLFHAHNIFLDITLQMGIGGLIVFLLLIFKILKIHWHSFKQEKTTFQGYLALSIIVITIGFFVRNLFDTLFVSDSAAFIWFLWAMGISQYLHRAKNND